MQQGEPHGALLQPLSGAPQLIELRGLIDSVVRHAETGLRQLTNDLSDRSDSERSVLLCIKTVEAESLTPITSHLLMSNAIDQATQKSLLQRGDPKFLVLLLARSKCSRNVPQVQRNRSGAFGGRSAEVVRMGNGECAILTAVCGCLACMADTYQFVIAIAGSKRC